MPCSGSAASTVASHSRTVESARSRRWVCPWRSESAVTAPCCRSCWPRRQSTSFRWTENLSGVASTVRVVFDGQPPPIPVDGVPIPAQPDGVAAHLSDLELVSDIWAADARESRHVAERAAAIAALARRRSAERDRDFGSLGKPGLDSQLRQPEALREISETFVTELAMIRGCSEEAAQQLAVESI